LALGKGGTGYLWGTGGTHDQKCRYNESSWEYNFADHAVKKAILVIVSRNLLVESFRYDDNSKVVYWHRELPPCDAEIMGEHTVEATSGRVPGTFAHRDELWDRCYDDLMTQTRARLEQEVVRLEGHYAHVLDESVDSRHDDASGETWLHGRFTYVLYRRRGNA